MFAVVSDRHEDELLSAVERLMTEFPTIPAGSVMRCFARAVRHNRQLGCPHRHLSAAAEASARLMLAQRAAGKRPTELAVEMADPEDARHLPSPLQSSGKGAEILPFQRRRPRPITRRD